MIKTKNTRTMNMKTTRKIQSNITLLVLNLSLVFLGGCSALPRHEHVVGDIRTSENGAATVCLEGRNIQNGKTLEIFESNCRRKAHQKRWSTVTRVECVDQKVSDAIVISSENIHEVVLKTENMAPIKAGSFVKKN